MKLNPTFEEYLNVSIDIRRLDFSTSQGSKVDYCKTFIPVDYDKLSLITNTENLILQINKGYKLNTYTVTVL